MRQNPEWPEGIDEESSDADDEVITDTGDLVLIDLQAALEDVKTKIANGDISPELNASQDLLVRCEYVVRQLQSEEDETARAQLNQEYDAIITALNTHRDNWVAEQKKEGRASDPWRDIGFVEGTGLDASRHKEN